jgi:hypothetical protein
MNSQLTRFLVFLGICVVFALGIYVYISAKAPQINPKGTKEQFDGVPFKEVFDNFRKTSYETPSELYAAFENVNKKLEAEKGNLTNYRQDKEDLLSSVATNVFPWADTVCKTFEYKWEFIEPCLKICQELKNNKTILKSSIGDKAEQYYTSLSLFSTFEKYKNNKLNVLSKQFNADTKTEYIDLQNKIYSNANIKNNLYFREELKSWSDELEGWNQLDTALRDNNYQVGEPQAILNKKFSELSRICDLLNRNTNFESYTFYREQTCFKKDELAEHLKSLIEQF